jgi:hypothetical protein
MFATLSSRSPVGRFLGIRILTMTPKSQSNNPNDDDRVGTSQAFSGVEK